MPTAMLKKPLSSDAPLPYTIRLPDGGTIFVEMPAKMVRRDRDGSIGFTLEGVRLLDRIRALAMRMGDHPTPGHIAALRQALGLTQKQLGEKVGVAKLTVSRWERGQIKPGSRSVAALMKLRAQGGRKGVLLPA